MSLRRPGCKRQFSSKICPNCKKLGAVAAFYADSLANIRDLLPAAYTHVHGLHDPVRLALLLPTGPSTLPQPLEVVSALWRVETNRAWGMKVFDGEFHDFF
jgi:hypothetical protein